MFWKITAISLGIACLILAYRNRRLLRIIRYKRKPGWESRVVEFMGKGEE